MYVHIDIQKDTERDRRINIQIYTDRIARERDRERDREREREGGRNLRCPHDATFSSNIIF